jgi:hypothetical protein
MQAMTETRVYEHDGIREVIQGDRVLYVKIQCMQCNKTLLEFKDNFRYITVTKFSSCDHFSTEYFNAELHELYTPLLDRKVFGLSPTKEDMYLIIRK